MEYIRAMVQDVENQLVSLLASLRGAGKTRLANCIEENWQKTPLAYSQELNTYTPARKMEPELKDAFAKELERLDIKNAAKILESIRQNRILQTAPHLGATESPRMLSVNWLGSLGVAPENFYIVAMFSGIPFSNQSRPGRINREKDPVNLFASNMQDGLVYQSVITEKLLETWPTVPEKLKKLALLPKLGDSYTKWALTLCGNIEREILGKENLVYLDINEVVSNYLVQILQDKNHIFYKIFFDTETRAEFDKAFPEEIMFYSAVTDGKYEKMKNVTISEIDTPENLVRKLKEERLCPGLIVGFLALAFLNEFKCFGSFAQVEYLPVYQEKLAKLSFLKDLHIEKVPTSNLTTGMLPGIKYPVDILESGEKFTPNPEMPFGEMLLPIKDVLLGSYFIGDKRT